MAGVSGRYVRVFDLEKQQKDAMISRDYDENQNKGNQNMKNLNKIKQRKNK